MEIICFFFFPHYVPLLPQNRPPRVSHFFHDSILIVHAYLLSLSTRHDSDRLRQRQSKVFSTIETCVIPTRDKSPKRAYSNAIIIARIPRNFREKWAGMINLTISYRHAMSREITRLSHAMSTIIDDACARFEFTIAEASRERTRSHRLTRLKTITYPVPCCYIRATQILPNPNISFSFLRFFFNFTRNRIVITFYRILRRNRRRRRRRKEICFPIR